jgi:transcriptional/translational regulatory protein YebC/TACO1
MIAIEGGANDVIFDEESAEIVGPVEAFKTVSDQLRMAGIKVDDAGIRMVPTQELELSIDDTLKVMKVIDALEDLDDVQDVYSNLSISDEVLTQLETD